MIVVTGANGLLGASVVEKFLTAGFTVRATVRNGCDLRLLEHHRAKLEIVEADVLDMPAVITAFKGVDTVVHAAAVVSFNPRRRKQIFEVNVEGTRNVVNACLVNNVTKLIHVSSTAALRKQKGATIVNENDLSVGENVSSDYGSSKFLSELEVYRGMEEGLKVSIVNPSVVLAPGDGVRSSSRIFGYIWSESAFYTNYVVNYVDVRDVTEIIIKLHREDHNGERFIVNAGSCGLKEILDMVALKLSKRAPSINVPQSLMRTAAVFEAWRAWLTRTEPLFSKQTARVLSEPAHYDNSKARERLGIEFQPLERTLEWCCNVFRSNNTNK
jgi:nucleoside-diphosphate-sugar epimerase